MKHDPAHVRSVFDAYQELDEHEQQEISRAATRRAHDALAKLVGQDPILDSSPSAFAHRMNDRVLDEFVKLMESEHASKIRQAAATARSVGREASHWSIKPDAYQIVRDELGPNRRSLKPRRGPLQIVSAQPGLTALASSFRTPSDAHDQWEAGRE